MIEFHLNHTNNKGVTSEEVIKSSDYLEVRSWAYRIIGDATAHHELNHDYKALTLEALFGNNRFVRHYGWTNKNDMKKRIREDIKDIIDLMT